jgi:hypothetical protein
MVKLDRVFMEERREVSVVNPEFIMEIAAVGDLSRIWITGMLFHINTLICHFFTIESGLFFHFREV